jgi:hypothetical protein
MSILVAKETKLLRHGVLAVASLAMFGGVARAQEPSGDAHVRARVEACIDEHAPDVERATTSLTDAVGFLVQNLCAVEVHRLNHYHDSASKLAAARKAAVDAADDIEGTKKEIAEAKAALATYREALDRISVDPETGDITIPPAPPHVDVGPASPFSPGDFFDPISPDLRAVAARAVLNARLARTK